MTNEQLTQLAELMELFIQVQDIGDSYTIERDFFEKLDVELVARGIRTKENIPMSTEQVGAYARELMAMSSPIEAYLGTVMHNVLYGPESNSVEDVVSALNGRRGSTYEIEQVIETIIANIQGK